MRGLILCAVLALTGCAGFVQPRLGSGPLQDRATELVNAYNVRHGTHYPVPAVRVGSTFPLFQAQTWCPRQPDGTYSHGCYITVRPSRAYQQTAYALANTLPHEVAHALCAMAHPDTDYRDHGPAWRAIALELGLDPHDIYMQEDER